jgi:hypothetical protein
MDCNFTFVNLDVWRKPEAETVYILGLPAPADMEPAKRLAGPAPLRAQEDRSSLITY